MAGATAGCRAPRRAHAPRGRLPAGRPGRVERERLAHRHEPKRLRLGAERARVERVFDVEDGLARGGERPQEVALAGLEALLVERPVVVWLQLGGLAEV